MLLYVIGTLIIEVIYGLLLLYLFKKELIKVAKSTHTITLLGGRYDIVEERSMCNNCDGCK